MTGALTMTKQSRIPEVTEKNKKNEILAAYNELLKKVQNTTQESHQDEVKREQELEIVKAASSLSDDKIVKKLADVKVVVGQTIERLEQQLSDEFKRLKDLQDAITFESNSLQELYQIKKNAHSLSALLLAQKEYKERFEYEKAQQRLAWENEKKQQAEYFEESQRDLKQKRKREEEEYAYTKKLERQKDDDLYQEKKTTLEKQLKEYEETITKQLNERELVIKAKEDELEYLNEQVGQFSSKLSEAVEQAEIKTRQQVENDFNQQIALAQKEQEGNQKLAEQLIASLRSKIAEQEAFIKELSQKTESASQQAQSIALKALESSKTHFVGSFDENKINAKGI